MNPVTLVLGGTRSGKSRHAEAIVTAAPPPWLYVATGQASDDEMRERIDAHRRGRGPGWRTVEAPVRLAETLAAARGPVLVDCLTLWLGNLLLQEVDLDRAFAELRTALLARRDVTVLVSSEVGMGIVPENRLARRFRDQAGLLNQHIAALADRVVLVVAGCPLVLK